MLLLVQAMMMLNSTCCFVWMWEQSFIWSEELGLCMFEIREMRGIFGP
jgi:hypothetical protein